MTLLRGLPRQPLADRGEYPLPHRDAVPLGGFLYRLPLSPKA